MNIEAQKTRFREINLSSDGSMLLLQKINAQIVEFNPQGTLAAIGCKYGIILILDMLSKVVVRSFSIYHNEEDYNLKDYTKSAIFKANIDVDYFSPYKTNHVYLEDDFVQYQSMQANNQNAAN